jgi:hypothetical protein
MRAHRMQEQRTAQRALVAKKNHAAKPRPRTTVLGYSDFVAPHDSSICNVTQSVAFPPYAHERARWGGPITINVSPFSVPWPDTAARRLKTTPSNSRSRASTPDLSSASAPRHTQRAALLGKPHAEGRLRPKSSFHGFPRPSTAGLRTHEELEMLLSEAMDLESKTRTLETPSVSWMPPTFNRCNHHLTTLQIIPSMSLLLISTIPLLFCLFVFVSCTILCEFASLFYGWPDILHVPVLSVLVCAHVCLSLYIEASSLLDNHPCRPISLFKSTRKISIILCCIPHQAHPHHVSGKRRADEHRHSALACGEMRCFRPMISHEPRGSHEDRGRRRPRAETQSRRWKLWCTSRALVVQSQCQQQGSG